MRGFTLIELMIVIAIIGILASIAIPQYANYRKKSLDTTALSDLRNLMTAEEAEFSDSQLYVAVTPGVGPSWLFGHTKFVSKHIGFNINTNNLKTNYAIFTGYIGSNIEYSADAKGEILFKTINQAGIAAQGETIYNLSGWGGSSL